MRLQTIALATAVLAACASSQVRTSADARIVAQLRDVLQPSATERIAVLTDSTARWLPGVTCLRATRAPRPLAHAEDARPRVAAMVVTARDTVLVAGLADLTRAWRAVSVASQPYPADLASSVTALIRCTGLVSEGELISSLEQLQSKAPRQAFRDTSAVDAVGAPAIERNEAAVIVVFYASMPTGLYRYRVRIEERSGTLSIERELLSALKMRM